MLRNNQHDMQHDIQSLGRLLASMFRTDHPASLVDNFIEQTETRALADLRRVGFLISSPTRHINIFSTNS